MFDDLRQKMYARDQKYYLVFSRLSNYDAIK